MEKINYAIIGFGGIAETRIAKEGFCCDTERFGKPSKVNLTGATDLNPDRRMLQRGALDEVVAG